MKTQKHQGWENYETMAIATWIDNDRELAEERDKLIKVIRHLPLNEEGVKHKLASEIKSWVEDLNPLKSDCTGFADLVSCAISDRIAWLEIADHFLAD